MNTLRDSLLSKIDIIVADLSQRQHENDGTHLVVEATLVDSSQLSTTSYRKFVLGHIDIANWRALSSSSSERNSIITKEPKRGRRRATCSPDSETPAGHGTDQTSQQEAFSSIEINESANVGAQANQSRPRRKEVGGWRPGNSSRSRTPSPLTARRLATDPRNFPKRRRMDQNVPKRLSMSTVDKLIESIWARLHTSNILLVPADIGDIVRPMHPATNLSLDFIDVSRRCRVLTGVSQTARSIEIMIQAHWVACYDARVAALQEQRPDLRFPEHKKLAITEACSTFEWSEKELRNRMGIWRGYLQIKDSAGWAALAFAGPGIYRFCKYRTGFNQEAMMKLETVRSRFEVAADTIHPHWRRTLTLVGVSTRRVYHGHPHDWVVSRRQDPVPLSWSYRNLHPQFTFRHIRHSVVDLEAWGTDDPRRVSKGPQYLCALCARPQSDLAEKNKCECFIDLFGPNARSLCPVQVFSTDNGRNNGLVACCTFERGAPVGEFVGVVTKDLEDVDVMQCRGAGNVAYQIWQGKSGNFTRFLNHSCKPNTQFQDFVWLGIKRTVVISRGVDAGKELTIDYSEQYWRGLSKKCLCGEACCRHKDAY